MLFDFIIIIAK